MKEINCNIIRDMLPLYVDDVVSNDTKTMVEEHLEHCEECQKEVNLMKHEVYIPAEKEDSIIKNFKKKWRYKKLVISGLSILLTGLILFGTYVFVFHYETVVPYSESLIKIETQDDGMLVSHYYGIDYHFVSSTHPINVKIGEEDKKAIFLYYTETFAESHLNNLINRRKIRDERNYIFQLGNKENIDVIYYVEFDPIKIIEEGDNWDEVLENGQVIWEK